MSDMRELYQEIILDHNKKPRNCYVMDCATRSADGHNPLCGDIVKVYLRIEDGIIEEISFQGAGCAICTASTSLMTESVKGKTVDEAREMFDVFHHMLTGVADEQGIELGKLRVFEGVREYPVRVKCATLAWHTLNAAMEGTDNDPVTTE
jgi:nitrogen fixation NifU-like protein